MVSSRVASPEAVQLLFEGSEALAVVEHNGIKVDVDYLNETIARVDSQITELKTKLESDKVFKRWRKRYKDKALLGSREQLATVLFDDLGIPYPTKDKTKTGRYRTDGDVLGKVNLPFVADYLHLGDLQKDRSTYLEGLRRQVVDGLYHPTFNLHTASTFRSSSGSDKESGSGGSDLNFQNLPIRDPVRGEMIRKAFIPRKGRRIVEVDFSGVEVRVACCYTKDPVLISEFTTEGKDPHRDTACQLFSLTKEQVEKRTTRDWTKNRFVFPQFYGSVYFQCAPSIWEAVQASKEKVPGTELTIQEHLASKGIKALGDCDPRGKPKPGTFEHRCKEVENNFWQKRFTVYDAWKKSFFAAYQRDGGFKTLTGFYIGAIGGKVGLLKRNDVTNYPVQGSAFHCLLWSVIQLVKHIRKHKMKAKVIGQIHDSVLFDCPDNEVQDLLTVARRIMTRDLPRAWTWICVGMETESEVTPIDGSWYQKSQWVDNDGTWGPKKK